jgi:hypothetical protein
MSYRLGRKLIAVCTGLLVATVLSLSLHAAANADSNIK